MIIEKHIKNSGLRRAFLLAIAAISLAVLAALPTASRAQTLPYLPDQVVRIEGQGWGHGVGMSQWGARGRAYGGQTAEDIVRAYYQGVELSEYPTDQTSIRVLIDKNYRPSSFDGSLRSSNTLIGDIIGVGGEWAIAGATGPLPAGARLRLLDHPGGGRVTVRLLDAAGNHMLDFDLPSLIEIIPLKPETRLLVHYKFTASAGNSRYFDLYRGLIRVYKNSSGLIDTVNVVNMEDYLLGVVPAEMPSHWPTEALKAQAMVARTFAINSLAPNQPLWDVDDTTQYQVYLGVNRETPEASAAIQATHRRAITHEGVPIRSYFFSTGNGHTENNEDVFGGSPVPYLRGVLDLDPAGRPWDADSPRSTWATNAFPLTTIETVISSSGANIGQIASLDFNSRTASGRLITVAADGGGGRISMDAWDFVSRFNRTTPNNIGTVLSTRFNITFAYPHTRRHAPLNLPDGQSVYFEQTGHNIRHGFLKYFNENGGVAAFGLPLTEEFVHKGWTIQYFEKARMEFHPDKAGTRYEVQLGLINTELTKPRRPFTGDAPFQSVPQHRFFPETGHSVHFSFLEFWEKQGGLDRFGYPISQEVTENGRTVQHFQRARFEYYPDAPLDKRVQLASVGTELLRQTGQLP